jgi:phosphatidylinositol-3-phosphatase
MTRWAGLVGAVLLTVIAIPVVSAAPSLPTPAHIVIVVEENHSSGNVIGNKSAPFMNQLAAGGALMTQSYAETHPSEPNYLAMFSGSTFGLTSDACPVNAGAAPNLAAELLAAGYTFAGFSEDLPAVGSQVCAAGKYARKHVPWANFTNVPPETSVPFTAYGSLPTVSFVIPNLDNDMHDGTIAQADTWLATNLARYANWAVADNSLLIVTWDEDDNGPNNQIPTMIYGDHVRPGAYAEPISHYNVLSTIEEMYGLPKTGLAANAPAITNIWV